MLLPCVNAVAEDGAALNGVSNDAEKVGVHSVTAVSVTVKMYQFDGEIQDVKPNLSACSRATGCQCYLGFIFLLMSILICHAEIPTHIKQTPFVSRGLCTVHLWDLG